MVAPGFYRPVIARLASSLGSNPSSGTNALIVQQAEHILGKDGTRVQSSVRAPILVLTLK